MSRYRIRAVAELTGVSTATLRAWERRYGVPTPSRTASAYRLYGDEDVALVASHLGEGRERRPRYETVARLPLRPVGGSATITP